MADQSWPDRIEKFGKLVAAVSVIVGTTLAVGGWFFSVAMRERDSRIESMEVRIVELSQSINDTKSTIRELSDALSDEFSEIHDELAQARLTTEALRIETSMRCGALLASPGPQEARVRGSRRVRLPGGSIAAIEPPAPPMEDGLREGAPPETENADSPISSEVGER